MNPIECSISCMLLTWARFYRKLCFRFWRKIMFYDFGGKMRFYGFGRKMHFPVFGMKLHFRFLREIKFFSIWQKLHFPVLTGNLFFRFWRKIRFSDFSGKIRFYCFDGKLEKLCFSVLTAHCVFWFWQKNMCFVVLTEFFFKVKSHPKLRCSVKTHIHLFGWESEVKVRKTISLRLSMFKRFEKKKHLNVIWY